MASRRTDLPPAPHNPLFDGDPSKIPAGPPPVAGPPAQPDPSMRIGPRETPESDPFPPGGSRPPEPPPPVIHPTEKIATEADRAPTAAAKPAISQGIIVPPAKTSIARKTLEGTEIEIRSESESIAAQAKALVAARFLVAERRPRDVDEARIRILKECERPGFAGVAEYSKPQGDRHVTGPSIRFAEAALRLWGNVSADVVQVYDDAEKRTIRVMVCDLETNFTITKDQVFEKTVERKSPRKGQDIVGERVNTKGEVVYLVRATEEETLTKENAFASKVIRTQGLRIIPGDITAEALALAKATRRNRTAQDPDAERKRIADAFADLSVMPSALAEYLGCDLAQASPAQLDELRAVFVGIKEGDLTWKEALGEKADAIAAEAEKPKTNGGGKVDALKAKLAERKATKTGA